MACNRDTTVSGVDRDREAIDARTPSTGDIWQMSAASGGAPTSVNFVPTLLCAVLGRLIAKTGTAIEVEKLRLTLMLLQLTSTSRTVPYRETYKHLSKRMDTPRFDEALDVAISWGHIAHAPASGSIAGVPSSLLPALLLMGG